MNGWSKNYVGKEIFWGMTNSLDVDELIKQLLKVKQTGKQVGELIYFIVTFYQADMLFYHFLEWRFWTWIEVLKVKLSIQIIAEFQKYTCLVILHVKIQKMKKYYHSVYNFLLKNLTSTLPTLEGFSALQRWKSSYLNVAADEDFLVQSQQNNRNIRKRGKICSKLTIKAPEPLTSSWYFYC